MKRALVSRSLGVAAAGGHVYLAADYRLDPSVDALRIELHRAVKAAVVRYRQAVHAQFLGVPHKAGYPAQAVQHAVFGMDVEMDKRFHGLSIFSASLDTNKKKVGHISGAFNNNLATGLFSNGRQILS